MKNTRSLLHDLPPKVVFSGPPGSGKTIRLLELYSAMRAMGSDDRLIFLVPESTSREHLRDILARRKSDDSSDITIPFNDSGIFTPNTLIRKLGGSPNCGLLHLSILLDKWVNSKILDVRRWKVLETSGGRKALARAVLEIRDWGYSSTRIQSKPELNISIGELIIRTLALWEEWLGENSNRRDNLIGIELAVVNAEKLSPELFLIDGFTEIPPLQWKIVEAIASRAKFASVAIDAGQYPSQILLDKFQSLGFEVKELNRKSRWNEKSVLHTLSSIAMWGRSVEKIEIPAEFINDKTHHQIKIIEAANRNLEASAIAREIAKLVKSGYKYSDIVIIAPDLRKFANILEPVFYRTGIPLRCYTDRSVGETLSGVFVSQMIKIILDDITDDSMLEILAHPYSGIEEIDLKKANESATQKYRIGGFEDWIDWCGKSERNSIREFLHEIEELKRMSDASRFGAKLNDLLLSGARQSWKSATDSILARESWAIKSCVSVIDGIISALSEFDKEIDPKYLASKITEELRESTAMPLDRRRDCVNAITFLIARTWSAKVAFVAGLSRDLYPAVKSQEIFLPDSVKKLFDPPMPDSREFFEREIALFRNIVTRGSEKLFLLRPEFDNDSNPLQESIPLKKLTDTFAPIRGEIISKANREIPESTDDILFASDIVSMMYRNHTIDTGISLTYKRPIINLPYSGINPKVYLSDGEHLKAWVTGQIRPVSPTRLTDRGKCRYRFFASHVLGLSDAGRDRVKDRLTPMQWGNISHSALRAYYEEKERIADLVRDFAEKELHGIPFGIEIDGEIESMIFALERFLRFEHKYLSNFQLQNGYRELSFGLEERGEKPVEIDLGDETKFILSGKIDRVDFDDHSKAFIFDYKRSSHSVPGYQEITKPIDFQLWTYIALVKFGLQKEIRYAGFIPLRSELPSEIKRAIVEERFKERIQTVFEKHSKSMKYFVSMDSFEEIFISALRQFAIDAESGDITPLPANNQYCEKCAFSSLCRYIQIDEDEPESEFE